MARGATANDGEDAERDMTAATDAAAALAALTSPEARDRRFGALLAAAAALLWIPQALCLAWALGALFDEAARTLPPALLFVAIGAARAGLEAWSRRTLGACADAAVARLRKRIAAAAARWSPQDAGRPQSGRLAALAADQADALETYVVGHEAARMKLMVAPVAVALAAASVSWLAAALLLLFGAAIPLLMARVGRAAQAASDRQLAEIADMNALLLERLRAAPDLRVLGAVSRAEAAFAAAAHRVRERTMAVLRVAFLTSGALEICASLGVAAVALHAGLALSGVSALGFWSAAPSLTAAIFVILLAPEFFHAFREYAGAYHDRAGAMSLAAATSQTLDRAAPSILGAGAPAAPLQPPAADAPALRFADVGFVYEGADEALDFGSFEIRAGESVAIMGASGAGKSTLMMLAAGLARPSSGRIETLGRALTDDTADAWRARLAWIGQKPHAVSASLRANIAFYDPSATSNAARIAAAAERAAFTDVAARTPQGMATRLGESGAGLSGGEARRLGVARLAFARRDVILADEPTAALDRAAASAVSDGLLALRGDLGQAATLIVATHDEALAARLDRVVRLPSRAAPRASREAPHDAAAAS